MKDRIKRIMESQHMTQQVFAQFIKIAPATLSGIFNGRTNPSLNIVESIKQSLPSISTDWLIFGQGPMYMDVDKHDGDLADTPSGSPREQVFDFGTPPTARSDAKGQITNGLGVTGTPNNPDYFALKNIDKPQRKITEIRIFFDDQTFESFVPKK